MRQLEHTRQRWWLVVPAVGLVFVVVGVWLTSTRSSVAPDVVEGWAMPNMRGTAISLHDSDDTRDGSGYVIAGASWAGPDDVWHDGADSPTCVGTDTTTRTRVQLGIVDVDADHGSWAHVVWLRCLE
jgi:hypothetical protein